MWYILQQYLITFGWAITGAISMAISLGILVKIFSKITPINEWEEIKKRKYWRSNYNCCGYYWYSIGCRSYRNAIK